ncbi:MAG: hypothetical protein J0H61_02430 [Alphaproteobacteria bacterium]|nr:hypothetical protein [Alphaproteobacteria bacterium]
MGGATVDVVGGATGATIGAARRLGSAERDAFGNGTGFSGSRDGKIHTISFSGKA